MKAFIPTNITLILLLITVGCQRWVSDQMQPGSPEQAPGMENMFTVPGQLITHSNVYSVQLFRRGSVNSSPLIRLGSGEQLVLRFDMIESGTRQFRATITHHNPDWSRSPLPPEEFADGFAEAFFSGSRLSESLRPPYRQYEYHFPNQQLALTKSGNYMIRIEDFETRTLLFSLPFYIHENEGELRSSVETILTPRVNLRTRDIPGSTYEYPEFVDAPQFDLHYYFTQNRFWGRTRQADIWDSATEGSVFFELSREQAFTADYGIRTLNIQNLSSLGSRIREYNPDRVPPMLVLSTDVQGLGTSPGSLTQSRSGSPDPDLRARYGHVHFQFQPRRELAAGQEIYLTGDFNNWAVLGDLALQYNPDNGLWETDTFIKEGIYSYKYILIDGNRILDLELDDLFRSPRQEYTTFVYYRDPARRYYRLLQTATFLSN